MTALTADVLVRSQAVIEAFDLAESGALVYGRRVVAGNAYASHLWQTDWAGRRAERLTRGGVRDAAPAFSPDGQRIAFLRSAVVQPGSDGDEARAQVWVISVDGGKPWQVTRLEHGVTAFAWSPDGRSLALVAPAGAERFVVGRTSPRAEPTARRITATDWRDDESGLVGRRHQLFRQPVRRRSRATRLTSGDFDVSEPVWSPDGTTIAFTAGVAADWNIDPRTRICGVAAAGGPARQLVRWEGTADRAAFSPDGRWLAFAGIDHPDPPDEALIGLWVQRVDGRGRRCLTADLDLAVEGGAWADLALADDGPGPIWVGPEELVVLVGVRGRNLPYRVRLDGTPPEPLLDPAARVVGSAIRASGGRLALSAAVDGRASEVGAVEAGRFRRLTRNGSAWQTRHPRPRFEELAVPGPTGPIQVWLASPADAGARALPTILHFHGGPTGCWAPGGTMDATLLTAHGYRVAMPNIRGSATHGSAWIAALGGRWGEVDAADALAVADELVGRGLADPGRMGTLGLSYGGFLVQWLAGVTDRFAAAVAENGVGNQISAWGSSYFAVHYNRRARLGDPLTPGGVDQLWRTSPMRNVAAFHTPLLLLQAAEDRICAPADNEQLFVALKVLGRTVEYVLYPEEHHEMKNYGRPDRRIDRQARILEWFDRYLSDRR